LLVEGEIGGVVADGGVVDLVEEDVCACVGMGVEVEVEVEVEVGVEFELEDRRRNLARSLDMEER
jgi:hypothetical protein